MMLIFGFINLLMAFIKGYPCNFKERGFIRVLIIFTRGYPYDFDENCQLLVIVIRGEVPFGFWLFLVILIRGFTLVSLGSGGFGEGRTSPRFTTLHKHNPRVLKEASCPAPARPGSGGS